MTQPINFSVSDGIGHLELNRPEAANTVNMALAHGLHEAAIAAANSDNVRVVLMTGAGKRFCGGGDIGAITAADDSGAFITELASTADAGVQALEALDRPVIAGGARGGRWRRAGHHVGSRCHHCSSRDEVCLRLPKRRPDAGLRSIRLATTRDGSAASPSICPFRGAPVCRSGA